MSPSLRRRLPWEDEYIGEQVDALGGPPGGCRPDLSLSLGVGRMGDQGTGTHGALQLAYRHVAGQPRSSFAPGVRDSAGVNQLQRHSESSRLRAGRYRAHPPCSCLGYPLTRCEPRVRAMPVGRAPWGACGDQASDLPVDPSATTVAFHRRWWLSKGRSSATLERQRNRLSQYRQGMSRFAELHVWDLARTPTRTLGLSGQPVARNRYGWHLILSLTPWETAAKP